MLISRPDLVHLDRAGKESGADRARLSLPDTLYTCSPDFACELSRQARSAGRGAEIDHSTRAHARNLVALDTVSLLL